MKKVALKLMLTMLSSVIVSSVSLNSYAETSPNTEYTISRQDMAMIVPKVISVDVNAEKGDKSYMIKALGTVTNRSNIYLKNVQVLVRVTDKNRNGIDQIKVDLIDSLEPGQEKAFKVEKYINTNVESYDVRAEAEITGLEGANTYQMALWYSQGKKDNLMFWNVPVNESYFQNDSWLRNQAISMLLGINKTDKDYEKALDLLNELHYTESLIALAANDFRGGIDHLAAMNLTRKYGDKAEKLIDKYRPRVIYEKVKPLVAAKKYIEAIPLLRSIAPGTEYFDLAQTDLKNIYFYFKHRNMWTKLPELKGSDDQKKILALMEMSPEKILNNTPAKDIVTWVFPDYSRFNFDQNGRLLNYKLYPLH